MKDLQEKIKGILNEWQVIGTKPGTNFALDIDDLAKELAERLVVDYAKTINWIHDNFEKKDNPIREYSSIFTKALCSADIITINEEEK